MLSDNFKEGLLGSRAELLSSSTGTLPAESSMLGKCVMRGEDASTSVHHVTLSHADSAVKVRLICQSILCKNCVAAGG